MTCGSLFKIVLPFEFEHNEKVIHYCFSRGRSVVIDHGLEVVDAT